MKSNTPRRASKSASGKSTTKNRASGAPAPKDDALIDVLMKIAEQHQTTDPELAAKQARLLKILREGGLGKQLPEEPKAE